MRAVGTPATLGTTLGTTFGSADAPAGGTQTPGGASDRGAPALPFAAMLATRLARPTSGSASSARGEAASERDEAAGDEDLGPDASLLTSGPLPAPTAALLPAATTAAPAATTPNANVRHASRDANSLAPALRERLGRVVTRMQREYGHDVQIAEAGRTQARQDYLFTQGRTRSGPVVTWTHDSAHTRGRAVDVTIDGGYDDAAAFARLQQIAQAEGLRTLGARDPGHLELPRDVPGDVPALALGDGAAARITVESFGVRTEPSVAAVAPVAQVASVAAVAPVATVASIAVPGAAATPGLSLPANEAAHADAHDAVRSADHGPGRNATHARPSPDRDGGAAELPRASRPVPAPAAGDARPRGERERSDDRPAGGRDDARDPRVAAAPREVTPAAPVASAVADVAAASPGGPALSAASAATASATPAGGPLLGAVAAERIARVLDAQQAAAPRTISHLTLRVERADGGDDRIRLDLRGRAVEARIDVADLGAADHLAAHTPELRAALAERGLTTDDVRVRSTGGGALGTASLSTSVSGVAARAGAAVDTSSQHASDGDPGDPTPRDSGGGSERQPDERPSGRGPRDGAAADGGARDQRRDRRPAPDAYLDLPAPHAAGRTTH